MKWLKELIAVQSELTHVLQMACEGISTLQSAPAMLDALAKLKMPVSDKIRTDAARMAVEAQKEIDSGFTNLYSLGAVALWSFLEVAMEQFAVDWLETFPHLLTSGQIGRLRVRLEDYETLQGEDRLRFIINSLKRENISSVRPGAARFDAFLTPLGITCRLDEKLRKALTELNSVRNLVAHRMGVADKRFCDSCPWLGCKVGDRVVVDLGRFRTYGAAIHEYLALVFRAAADQGDWNRANPAPASN